MMKRTIKVLGIVMLTAAVFSSCTTMHKTMKAPNVRVELNKKDFVLSEQLAAEATSNKIVGIDFERLFLKKTGEVEEAAAMISLASLPVIGNVMNDKTSNYALYELMSNNPGYDVIFYPQYETIVEKPILGLGFIMKTTTVKTKARLGKLDQ